MHFYLTSPHLPHHKLHGSTQPVFPPPHNGLFQLPPALSLPIVSPSRILH